MQNLTKTLCLMDGLTVAIEERISKKGSPYRIFIVKDGEQNTLFTSFDRNIINDSMLYYYTHREV